YSQAFYTLFLKHDSYKGVFIRKHHTEITIDRFKDVFANFCARTYSRQQIIFTRDEITDFISKSLIAEEIDAAPEDFLNDLVESVCLIQRDGYKYSFVHRSFQEYFTALYLTKATEIDLRSAIDQIAERGNFDRVISMLRDMMTDKVDREWTLVEMEKRLKEINTYRAKGELEYASYFIRHISGELGGGITVGWTRNASRYFGLQSIFNYDARSIFRSTNIGTLVPKKLSEKFGENGLSLDTLREDGEEGESGVVIFGCDDYAISSTVFDEDEVLSFVQEAEITKWLDEGVLFLEQKRGELVSRLERRTAAMGEVFGFEE
ncbi:MAG: hypothetical protein PVI23_13795, partial [Maricaulaceae bacterium]